MNSSGLPKTVEEIYALTPGITPFKETIIKFPTPVFEYKHLHNICKTAGLTGILPFGLYIHKKVFKYLTKDNI